MSMHPNDYLCSNCYKVHLSILKSLESKQQEPDCMLQSLTEIWIAKVSDEDTDALTRAVLKAALFVANQFLQQKAVLLPWVSHIFLQAYGVDHTGSIMSPELNLEVGESTVKFSSRWLLNQLIIYLNPYMSYQCVHRKFGTILYRKGVDILTSLSWALGSTPAHSPQPDEDVWIEGGQKDETHKQRVLNEAGHILNDLIHDEIKRSINAEETEDPSTLNIPKYLEGVSPLLMEFIITATTTVRERQRSSDISKHVKMLRQYFILCLLLYCTNPKQPTHLHNLLADVVEVCGGSRQLLRVLNRLGCVSSPDTHDRFVTQHAEATRQTSIWNELPKDVFTVASADNFDKLQSYAAVYCGNQQRSYHGTTLQLVQPRASLKWLDQGNSEQNHSAPTTVQKPGNLQGELPITNLNAPPMGILPSTATTPHAGGAALATCEPRAREGDPAPLTLYAPTGILPSTATTPHPDPLTLYATTPHAGGAALATCLRIAQPTTHSCLMCKTVPPPPPC